MFQKEKNLARSGGRLVAVSIPLIVLAIILAYRVDSAHGDLAANLIRATLVLGFTGVALLLYGLGKVVVGLVTRK